MQESASRPLSDIIFEVDGGALRCGGQAAQ